MNATMDPQVSPRLPSNPGLHRLVFRALGTHCEVQYQPRQPGAAQPFEQAVCVWVENFEARYSRFLPDSLISRINQNAGVG